MNELSPAPDLLDRVLKKIKYEHELLLLQRRLILYFCIILASFSAMVFAAREFIVSADQSGFLLTLRLLLTDFGAISANLKVYLLSLIESMPSISMAVLSLVGLILLMSLGKFFRYVFKLKRLNS